MLGISGETKRGERGIAMRSQFDRAFAINRDVDTSKDGVLTIVAPNYQVGAVKEIVRRIDIMESKT